MLKTISGLIVIVGFLTAGGLMTKYEIFSKPWFLGMAISFISGIFLGMHGNA